MCASELMQRLRGFDEMSEKLSIVAIIGSRRKQGNTNWMARQILRGAESAGAETEIIYLGDYDLEACTGCEGCARSFSCVIRDDYSEIVRRLDRAHGVVLASPTYWYSVTSDMKRFIDRSYSLIQFPEGDRRLWISKYEKSGKACVTVAVCEQADASMMGNTATLLNDFSHDLGFKLIASLKGLGVFEAGTIQQDSDLAEEAFQAGKRLMLYLTSLKT